MNAPIRAATRQIGRVFMVVIWNNDMPINENDGY